MPAHVGHKDVRKWTRDVSAKFGTIVVAFWVTMGALLLKFIMKLKVDISHFPNNFVRLNLLTELYKLIRVQNLHEVV